MMLEAFASVGARLFDVTWTDGAGEKQLFRRGVALDILTRSMPGVLGQAIRRGWNLIVRPHAPPVFLQLDDLNAEAVTKARPAAFLTLETSPGNYQAWLSIAGEAGEDFARRVRKRIGADLTASGATRVAGSLNFKERYAPEFPRVAIRDVEAGRVVAAGELMAMGLVAPPDVIKPPRVSRSFSGQRNRKWPDYERCLDGAPANQGASGPDVSRADYTWCLIAADWGWGVEETARRLMEQSTKAQENGERYAVLTATRAAEATARARRGAMKPSP